MLPSLQFLGQRRSHADRQGTATGVINNGKVYVIGVATDSAVSGVTEIYNPTKNAWTTGASMPIPRFVPASARVP